MQDPVKRPYVSPVREERAFATRRAIVAAAAGLFATRGYHETTVADIALAAGVSVDTIYASVGRKPEVVLAIVDAELGDGDSVDADDRPYVRAIREASSAEEKLRIYASALGLLLPRIAPIFEALRVAAISDVDCADALVRLRARRRANMALFVTEIRDTGRLRSDMTDDQVADLIWATNSPEFFGLLAERGWSADRFADTIGRLWTEWLLG